MSTGRIERSGPPAHGVHAAEVQTMVLVTLIGLLALFSLLSIMLGAEDPRQAGYDPRSEMKLWMRYGIR
jgi:hypothetical protein